MRHFVVLLIASLSVAACAEAPPTNNEVTSNDPVVVSDFTLSKKCSDGTDIYQIEGGSYATWDGQNSQWVKLSPGVTPNDYCD